MSLNLSRRVFLRGLGSSLIAAPAIVSASSLMPVRGLVMPVAPIMFTATWSDYSGRFDAVVDLSVVRRAFLQKLYVQLWEPGPLLRILQHDPARH
jgi:hypothetical protein